MATYDTTKARYCAAYCRESGQESGEEAIRHSPLVSLAVKYAIDEPRSPADDNIGNTSAAASSDGVNTPVSPTHADELRVEDYARDRRFPRVPTLPQYGLLGFDLGNRDNEGNAEPILLNTNEPSSVFLCGSQGSGKSYTLSCMLENHLLRDPAVGVQHETIPGFVFHYDTNGAACLAEAASLCSRGIKVRCLVSWNNYRAMKTLYEALGARYGRKIEVRPLLFQDDDLTATHIQNLMSFDEMSTQPPLYLARVLSILSSIVRTGNFSVEQFIKEVDAFDWQPTQKSMLDQRLNLLKAFTASATPAIVQSENKHLTGRALQREMLGQGVGLAGDCITVEKGTLTVVDLSGHFVDRGTACTLFDICLAVILKRHQAAIDAKRISPGFIVTLDEAHKYLDTVVPAAEKFTSSLLTTIREQRHNGARVIIATQEPSIAGSLLDLCSVSIIHRFTSPAWFAAIREHVAGASKMVKSDDDGERGENRADMFRKILALEVGESLVFSPNSWIHGGEVSGGGQVVEPTRLGSGVLWMRTRKREGQDAGKTVSVV
jgi:hypothetical protein